MRLAPFIAVAIMAVGARPLQAQAPADPAVPARLSLEDALARAIATSHRLAELRARGVKIEDYDTPALKTEDGIADLGFALAAWFIDPAGNAIGITQYKT